MVAILSWIYVATWLSFCRARTNDGTEEVHRPMFDTIGGLMKEAGTFLFGNETAEWIRDQGTAVHWRKERFIQEDDWKNELVLRFLPDEVYGLPRFARCWIRNYALTIALYLALGSAWSLWVYVIRGKHYFSPGTIPKRADVFQQIKVSMKAIPLYAILPCAAEWMVERGWTKAYAGIEEVGYVAFVSYFALYMACVEFGVYWMHRMLHESKWLYMKLHHTHHIYNKENTLSPFAGLAFHPLDGMLQAAPYVWTLFLVPMHFLTVELLLFATGVWTTNIHDNLNGRCEPIMGAAYHTIHHTLYRYNYGHYLTYMDRAFGTYKTPYELEDAKKR